MTVNQTDQTNFVATVLVICVAILVALFPQPASAQLGRDVTNVAVVTVDVDGVPVNFNTNPAVFTVEARRTPSTIEFFRYAPNAPDAIQTRINGSDYNPTGTMPDVGIEHGGADDPFIAIGAPQTTGGMILDFSGDVPLVPADRYLSGELMVVRVIDLGQNGNSTRIETLIVRVTSSDGDEILLRLYESGPDTGQFYAYIPSSRDQTPPFDPVLTAPENTTLTATYEDVFDATEVSVDTALVDPFGRVFDSLTGDLLDGVQVTIVDAATGAPAMVFGVDGVSEYPSTVITGAVITDASGLQYQLQEGEFLFPLMMPGDYRLLIEPLPGYSFPSGFAASAFEGLDNAPFEIIGGSYGDVFTVEATGPLNFDVPLDPSGEVLITKTTAVQTASVGDTVAYSIEITNRDVVPSQVRIQDTLPRGLRYYTGSARSDAGPGALESVSADGRTIVLTGGIVRPGEQVRLTYVASVTAGAQVGEAVNTAIAINAAGSTISNRAEASLQIVEDLLRSRSTLIGRVALEACDTDEDWAKELNDGSGVTGVRLYMETGEYVVTDERGLYHFEGVRPGTHVVQLDEATLPEGLEPVLCEENSRYADTATSKFVDAMGGTIWRANFYVKRSENYIAPEVQDAFDDTTEYQEFDADWLKTADPAAAWVYPETTRTPSARSVNIGIKHPARHSVALTLNGQPVPSLNYSGILSEQGVPTELSRWRGVDILRGENRFIATVTGPDGRVTETLEHAIWFVTNIENAVLVDDQSQLVADGRTPPVIAVRLEDVAGRPVHKGRAIEVNVSDPYQLRNRNQFEAEAQLIANTINSGISTGADGIALIELEPTLQTGRVRLEIRLDNGRTEEIDVYLTPEKRDWILVGLAEGSTALESLDGENMSGTDTMTDGRVAFFAKGMVKGDWLLTLAVDTSKRRGNRDGDLFNGQIDPNAYYTLYGDRTLQYNEAQSRYPLYVKLEKDTVQLLFGDYDTDLNDTQLGRFSRRLSGLKGMFQGRNVSANGFSAETNQAFVQDEIAADGTSGPYQLSATPLIRNSETITVETRDRLRPDQLVRVRSYTRFIDYDIDYVTGEVIFRLPVATADAAFNPNVIVAEYEVSENADRNITAGGRVAVHTADRRLEAGVTYIVEEGSDTAADASSDLAAVDLTARIDQNTEIRAEVATSSRDTETGTERADAYLLEAVRQSETLTVTGYVREDEEGFGLGQQSSATQAVRRLGADASLRLTGEGIIEEGQRTERFVDGRVYREENLVTTAQRDVAEATVRQQSQHMTATLGLKAASESFAGGEDRESVLATGSLSRLFPEQGLTLSASHEQPLYTSGDEATLFPERTQLGLDKTLTKWATLNLRHELNNGADSSGNVTVAGLSVRPWTGGEVRTSLDQVTQDSVSRLAATLGVDQSFQIDEQWSASFGASRRDRIDGGDAPLDVTADDAVSPLEPVASTGLANDETFTSLYGGLGYRTDTSVASARVEVRDSADDRRWTAVFGGAREASEQLSYGLSARIQDEMAAGQPDRKSADIRLGSAWRPDGEGAVIFNRLDAQYDEIDGEFKTRKLVNNLGMNWMMSDQAQAAVFWGIKYQESEVAGTTTAGLTQLLGAEVRHDVTRKIDVGVSGSVLIDHTTNTSDYSFGPSIGISPAKNIWASVGYNFSGFTDEDFEAAEYSRDGAYIKLRVKFDQHTAKDFLNRISPKAD